MELFKLFGTILVDNKEALNSISQTDDKAKGLMNSIGGGVRAVAGAAVAVGAATAAGATAIYGMAMKSAEATDRIDKMSNKIGVSKQAFQEWDYILGQNGMDVEKLQVGVKTLTQQMDAAAGGSKNAQEMFAALGLSWEDGTGKLKSQEQMTNEAITALAKMENGTEKARLATELFGKAGIEMMPMLNNGAEGIEELRQRAHDLGLVMSDEAVTAGVVLGDTIDDVKRSFGAVVTQIGVKVMPMIQQAADWLLENMPMIQKVVGKAFEIIGAGVSVVVNFITQLIAAWAEWAEENQDMIDAVMAAIDELWAWLQPILGQIIEAIGAFIGAISAFWEAHGEEIMAVVKPLWEAIKVIIGTALDVLMSLFKIFTALFKGDWSTFWEEIGNLLTSIWDGIIKLVPLLLEALIKAFEAGLSLLFNIGKQLFNALWDGLKNAWEDIAKWVGDRVTWLADKLAFWNKGKSQIDGGGGNVDGSHATGLAYVPFDGYVAELHKGERVLTAAQNAQLERGGDTINVNMTVNAADIQSVADFWRTMEHARRLGRMH